MERPKFEKKRDHFRAVVVSHGRTAQTPELVDHSTLVE